MKENGGLFAKLAKTKLMLLIAGGAGSLFSIFITLFPLFIAVFLVLGLLDGDGDSSANGRCYTTKTVDEICESITVTGYGDMSVDEYVAHVITNEFGSAPDETLKAQAVAARSYGISGATKDGNGNCVIGDTSEGFQTYAKTYTERAMQAAKDTSGIVLITQDGSVARAEYSSNSLPKAYSSYTGSTVTMSERNLEIPKSWFEKNKTCSDSNLNSLNGSNKDAYGRPVYGCGHGRGMGQIAAKYLDEEKGYKYDEILEYFYGEDSEYKWSLASSDGTTTKCDSSYNGNFQALSSYNLGHKGLNILNRTLTSSEKSKLDDYINSEVDKAGYGTGAAVAAAGQSLTYGLEQMGYYLGYCWGGDRSSVGVNQSWGSRSSSCNSPSNTHYYYGMDCSGFVDWAIRNACNSSFGGNTTYDLDLGPHIDVTKAKPGDLMLNTSSHVRLVLKNNGDGTVITAEEGGSVGDLNFSKHGNESGYNFIDMSSYYSKNCKDTNPATGNKRGSVSSSSSSSSSSSGNKKKKILLIAGHSYSPYCSKCTNECRGAASSSGYVEESETRKFVQKLETKLKNLGYTVKIANELLGENFNDKSTTKSLYCENKLNTSKFKSVNWSDYAYAIEIHFNASGNHSAKGVTTLYDSPRASIKALDSSIRAAVNGVLGTGDNGETPQDLTNTKFFAKLNVPFTYLELEYYDNKSAMSNYTKNANNVASAIANAINNYNSKNGFK